MSDFSNHDIAVVVHGHVGELVQVPVFCERLNREIVVLLSLPCENVGTRAVFSKRASGGIRLRPEGKSKAQHACQHILDFIGATVHAEITLEHIRPTKQGVGYGTSTRDIAAASIALLWGVGIPPKDHSDLLGALSVHVEGGSDPIFFPESAILFASREGFVYERLPGLIPRTACLSFDLGVKIDTAKLVKKQRADGFAIECIKDAEPILALLRHAVANRSPKELALAATASARLNQQNLAFPNFQQLSEMATEFADGIAISHSGSAATFLWDPHELSLAPQKIIQARAAIASTFGVRDFIDHEIGVGAVEVHHGE
jgi:uncharacterized protein involved in propanediol utilization